MFGGVEASYSGHIRNVITWCGTEGTGGTILSGEHLPWLNCSSWNPINALNVVTPVDIVKDEWDTKELLAFLAQRFHQ